MLRINRVLNAVFYFSDNMRRQGSFDKTVSLEKTEGSRKGGRSNIRWLNSIKEAIGMSLQELSRAVEDRVLWTLLICGIASSQSQLNGALYT